MHITHGKGIVLRRTYYSDADIIYEIFSEEQGRISVMAKGIRKQKSKNRGVMQLFSYIEYEVFTLNNSSEKTPFYRLKNSSLLGKSPPEDFSTQSACSLLSEISLEFLPVHQPMPEIFSLWKSFLNHGAFSHNSNLRFLIQFFSLLGLFPEFSHASDCQTPFTGEERIFWESDKGLFTSSEHLVSYKFLPFPLLKVFAFGRKSSFLDFEKIRFSPLQQREIWEIFWWFYATHIKFFPRSKKLFEECFFS